MGSHNPSVDDRVHYKSTSSGANAALTHVRVKNYKSIGKCDIELGRLTVLVGQNGSGKSNFLDALRFVVDGLQSSLDHAIKSRGSINDVRRRSTGHPKNFAIQLQIDLPDCSIATYGFEIGARPKGGFAVRREDLSIQRPDGSIAESYRLEHGELVKASVQNMPAPVLDRLFLVNASGTPNFRAVYDALLAMGFYSLNPESMKEIQSPDAGELLHRDGNNIASVIARLGTDNPQIMQRIKAYLSKVVPGINDVLRISLGPKETLQFKQAVKGAQHPWKFYANSMSDGTLRALGVLVAVTQLAGEKSPINLVGIEEPESALHPAAAGALMNALREAASQTQVIMTSHSPDLLDNIDPQVDNLIAVQSRAGNTELGPIDQASLDAIRQHLYSPGELLRMNQLDPDKRDLQRQNQLRLFDDSEESD